MKKTFMYLAAFALTAGFAACSSDDDITTTTYPEDSVVRFNVGVTDPQTRATQTSEGDNVKEFGISILNSASTDFSFSNVKVSGGNGNWSSGETTMLWQNNTQAVDIVAYTPYAEGDYNTTSTDLPVKVEDMQTKESYASDFLICKKTSFAPKDGLDANGKLPLNFKHALSQFTVTIELKSEFNGVATVKDNPITDVKINGTYIEGTCDFTKESGFVTAKTTDGDAAPVSVSLFESSQFVPATVETDHPKATYQCLLIPQTIEEGKLTVTFMVNGTPYTWTSVSSITFNEDTAYTLTLVAGKELVLCGVITASEWKKDENSEQNITVSE